MFKEFLERDLRDNNISSSVQTCRKCKANCSGIYLQLEEYENLN